MSTPISMFALSGQAISCERYGSGHINDSYRVETDEGYVYILQKINSHVFHEPQKLMENVTAIVRHLAKSQTDSRRILTLIPAMDGKAFYVDTEGEYWRVYQFISGGVCLEKVETAEDFFQSALAFGDFQNRLADFPAETLFETIPNFHDTPKRYEALHCAIQAASQSRVAAAAREITFVLERETQASAMMTLLEEGKLPLRVTHNDTKLNNVILDQKTRKALCVLDLDTVMPGLAANDFGDAIRFGASTAAEDEQELEKVQFSFELYQRYLEGFLTACGDRLTDLELQTLPLGAKLITLECGVRFLTDYLSGDAYFHISRPGQNLDRCCTQCKLVAEMERMWQPMTEAVTQAGERLLNRQL